VQALDEDEVGNLYAGGFFIRPDLVAQARVARYDPQQEAWVVLHEWWGVDEVRLAVSGTPGSGGVLYVGVQGLGIHIWDGNTWSALSGDDRYPEALAVHGRALYAAGDDLAVYDDGAWVEVGSLFAPVGAAPQALIANEGDLWIGGFFLGVEAGSGTMVPSLNIARYRIPEGVSTSPANNIPQSPRIMAVYPQPFSDVLTVEYEVDGTGFGYAELFDLLGRRVWNSSPQVTPSGSHRLHETLSHLPPGLYTLRLHHDGTAIIVFLTKVR
jgi:hypothetical protein